MSYLLEPVRGRRSRRRFADVPRAVLGRSPAFVPPLTSEEVKRLDTRKHPFFAHAEAGFWILWRGGQPVGRISATWDRLGQEWQPDGVGAFGHFLAPDEEGARLLLAQARQFLAARGARRLRGPIELSTNYTCGLQVSGFDLAPYVDMNQHPPGQEALLESCGLAKAKDLLAFRLHRRNLDAARLTRVRAISEKRFPARVRPLDPRRFAAEIATLHEVYESAWERNFGFVPMSRAEFERAAESFRSILVPELCLLAEHDGRALAFLIALPDVNLAIRACQGRLFPLGFLRLLRTLRSIHTFRVITLGVRPEARGRGLDARLILEVIERSVPLGYHEAELSWVLEDNTGMVKPLLDMGAHEAMRYRLFEGEV